MDHGNGMEVLVFGFRDVSLTNLLDELVHGPQHVAEISAGLPHACCSCVLVRGTRIYIYIYIYIPSPVASHTVHELPCNLDGRFIVPS